MAHAIERTDHDIVTLTMTVAEAEVLQKNLGDQWSGDHDVIWEALARRDKITS